VIALAEQNGKSVYAFEIKGGETLVDPGHYYDFIKSLGHVFRNSIVHGLEPYEERLALGKDERGRISCSVLESKDGLVLAISDDGRGIDPVHIRDIALKKSLCFPETVYGLSDEELVQLIFADGFSGAQEVDTLAGRGVGLSAVRAELEKIHGSVQVVTTLGKGTQFQFFLPFDPADASNDPYSIRRLAKPLLSAAEHLFLSEAGIRITNLSYIESAAEGKIALRKVTAFLGIKGIAKGRMVLSADHDVAALLVANRFADSTTDSTIDRMLETTLSHYAEIIFQHAMKTVPDLENSLTSEALVSILADEASAKYPQSETPTWVLDTAAGKITLSLIY
jgi:CheY-specific phosphatase CheX